MAQYAQRVAVFVDVQNMYYSALHQFDGRLNFAELIHRALNGRDLMRAIAYIVQNPEIDQSSFITMLRRNRYEVRSKPLQRHPNGSLKGDWDVGIVIDAISIADRVDAFVLVSGDGDFVDLLKYMKGRGVKMEVMAFPSSTSEELRMEADTFIPIGPAMLLEPTRALDPRSPICPGHSF